MKIERITYERLESLERFNNIKVGITAIVERGESAETAWIKVARFVHAKIRILKANQDNHDDSLVDAEFDEDNP